MTLRNAFAGLALEHTNSAGDAHLVSGSKLKYRREFNDPTFAAFDVSTGAGMTVNATNGALVITTGTTANSVTTLTTKQSFSAPFKAAFGFKVSQKIINQEFFVEMVAENPDGSLDETVVAAWRISGTDSTTTTVARAEVRNGGAARLQSANITVPTQTTDAIYEVVLESDEVWFFAKGIDSLSTKSASYMRNQVSPDPNRKYRLRYRIVNGAVAPASTTTITSLFLTAVDYTETPVSVTGSDGSLSAAQAMPIYITGGGVTMTSTTLAASATITGLTMQKVLSAATANNTLVKASAGRVAGYHLSNTGASWRYVKLYNKATAPVAGTDTPVATIPIGPGQTVVYCNTLPLSFATGIGFAITANPADNDATVVAANEIVGHIDYV